MARSTNCLRAIVMQVRKIAFRSLVNEATDIDQSYNKFDVRHKLPGQNDFTPSVLELPPYISKTQAARSS